MTPENQTVVRKMSTDQRESVEVRHYGYEAFIYLDAPEETALTPEEAWALSDMLREAARGKGYTGPEANEALDILPKRDGAAPLRHPGSYEVVPEHVPTWTHADLKPYWVPPVVDGKF